jgi:hypothetical protein
MRRSSPFVTNLRFSKKTRRAACASTVATGSCGLCCTGFGPVGGDVCRWFSPPQYSVGTAKLSSGIGPGNRAAFPEGQKWQRTFVISFGACAKPTPRGCTPHSRRTAQIRDCGGAIHGGQIFASVPQTAFPGLANLPDESSGTDRGQRFFHRTDGQLSGPVRLRRASA